MPRTPHTRTRTTTTTAFTPLTLTHTHHLTPYRPRPTRAALTKQLHLRFGLHSAGARSGFWREWASGCIVAQCDEGVFMFSHGFGYACLVAAQADKAARIIRGARDAEMEGAWRRAGRLYDAGGREEWPGDGREGGGEMC